MTARRLSLLPENEVRTMYESISSISSCSWHNYLLWWRMPLLLAWIIRYYPSSLELDPLVEYRWFDWRSTIWIFRSLAVYNYERSCLSPYLLQYCWSFNYYSTSSEWWNRCISPSCSSYPYLDPFNRMPLKAEMLQPQPELKSQIDQWLREKGVL